LDRTLNFIVGPTASGKTQVAHLVADEVGAEMVALDSMTVFRGMDVGTAKPAPDERRRYRYHLVDVVDPWEPFSVGRYVELAARALADVEARGARTLFAGGTALYLRALVEGFFDGPPGDAETRARLRDEAARLGPGALHDRLARLDPDAAARIHRNDLRRIVRALEVHELTGTSISELQKTSPTLAAGRGYRIWGLRRPRAALARRIEARVEAMFEAGFVDEVRALTAGGRKLGPQARHALGYTQVVGHLEGRTSLAEAVAATKLETRRFAKRQMTFFRSFPSIRWLRVASAPDLAEAAARVAEELKQASSPGHR
jgi:tRNA dimethylallyltransferase